MKKSFLFSVALLFAGCVAAQDVVMLPQPEMNLGESATLMNVLKERESSRNYDADVEVTDSQLGTILWAACGVNRKESGKITAPSAINAQDIVVYVCRRDGAFRYEARSHSLVKVSDRDLRAAVADRQDFAKEAPVSLVLVSDQSRFRSPNREMGAVDAGYVSQNICLVCTAMGLATVPRATMNREELATGLGLTENEVLFINHPVGKEKND